MRVRHWLLRLSEGIHVGAYASCLMVILVLPLAIVPLSLWLYFRATGTPPPDSAAGWIAAAVAATAIAYLGELALGLAVGAIGLVITVLLTGWDALSGSSLGWRWGIVGGIVLVCGVFFLFGSHRRANSVAPVSKALLDAVKRDDVVEVERLLKAGATGCGASPEGESPIHVAASQGNQQMIEALLDHGANVMAKGFQPPFGHEGATPLHYAAGFGHMDAASCLLERGAHVDARDLQGWTPLHWTAMNLSGQTLEILLQDGKEAAGRSPKRRAEIEEFISEGHPEMARLLLAHGAAVDATGSTGETPLHVAAGYGNVRTAKVLLAHHAKIEAVTSEGDTALTVAVSEKQLDMTRFLLDGGASLGAPAGDGVTALQAAAQANWDEGAAFLVDRGADVNQKGALHLTALHFAAFNGCRAAARELILRGADVNAVSADGVTPLAMARKQGYTAVAELIEQAGGRE